MCDTALVFTLPLNSQCLNGANYPGKTWKICTCLNHRYWFYLWGVVVWPTLPSINALLPASLTSHLHPYLPPQLFVTFRIVCELSPAIHFYYPTSFNLVHCEDFFVSTLEHHVGSLCVYIFQCRTSKAYIIQKQARKL